MEKFKLKYFLAANSCEGFISHFRECYDPKDGWKAYIIKGGPGTGKSSFMKFLAKKGADKGLCCELCPCSSDPDSLDAVIFPEIKTAVLDGTAPHTLDPLYPGACEVILDFGKYFDTNILNKAADEIISLTDKNRTHHKTASLYLQAAGKLMTDNLKSAVLVTNIERVENFAEKLCKKYLKNKNKKGRENIRFLAGMTPKGYISFADTVNELCKKIVVIEDNFGCVSDIIMCRIRKTALANGYDIISAKSALLPSLYDHIIIPELSLAFVRESKFQHFDVEVRRIHARRFMDVKKLHKSREKIKFNNKAIKELMLAAASTLLEAKNVHDQLEKYYVKSMDFEAVTEFATAFAEELFA
ncbi:MAG: hypothetical protein ACOYJS_03655 [Acutalibacteraceae bacterium]